MKRVIFIILAVAALIGSLFLWSRYGGLLRLYFSSTPRGTSDISGLNLPEGFEISILAEGLDGARVMEPDSLGNAWISQPSKGTVSLMELKDGGAARVTPIFRNLNRPHGLAFHPDDPFRLYIAEEDKVSYVRVYSEDSLHKILNLPSGGNHTTRTIGFGPDKMLYISIGSTCNVCNERDERRAAILRSDAEGKNQEIYARGLRNAVFFDWRADGKMFATEMGRDLLGDDIPPDEINVIERNHDYGWPKCYGKNVYDAEGAKTPEARKLCAEPFETQSFIDIQAHSAPLGLAFIPPNSSWPREYWNDLLVAYHGSWNRSVPTGYKIVRYHFDERGNYEGKVDDFLTGFLKNNGTVVGRPADILVFPNGTAYITDDYAGAVYKINVVDLSTNNE